MNLDPHWIKNKYKDKSIMDLNVDLIYAEAFEKEADVAMIQAEIERREKEVNEHHKPML